MSNKSKYTLIVTVLIVVVVLLFAATHKFTVEENSITSLADIYGWAMATRIIEEDKKTPYPFPYDCEIINNDDIFWLQSIEFDEQEQCYKANFKLSTTSVKFGQVDPAIYYHVWIDDSWQPCPIEQMYNMTTAYGAFEIISKIDITETRLLQFKKDGEMVAFPSGRYRAAKYVHITDGNSTGTGTGIYYITIEFQIPK